VVDLSEVIGAGPTGAVGQSARTLWQLLTAPFRAVELVLTKAKGAEPHSTAGVPAGGAPKPARKAVDIHPDSESEAECEPCQAHSIRWLGEQGTVECLHRQGKCGEAAAVTTRLLDEDEYESKLGAKDTKLCKLHGHEYTSTRWIKKCAVQGCMALGHTSGLNDGILKCQPHLDEARTRSVSFWPKARAATPYHSRTAL
jgi:hypothetical protein